MRYEALERALKYALCLTSGRAVRILLQSHFGIKKSNSMQDGYFEVLYAPEKESQRITFCSKSNRPAPYRFLPIV